MQQTFLEKLAPAARSGTAFGVTILLIAGCGHETQPSAASPVDLRDKGELSGSAGASGANNTARASAPGEATNRAGLAGSSASARAGAGRGVAATAPASSAGAGGSASAMTKTAPTNAPASGAGGMPATMQLPATAGVPAAGAAGETKPRSTACEKGVIKAAEVVFIGESFIAQSGAIPRLLTEHARKAGTIAMSESYRSFAVSGTQLTTGEIPMQYARAKADGPVKVTLMDGGGNDLLFGNYCKDGPASCEKVLTVVKDLFAQMGMDGVKDVLYFFYPDPMGIGADIKAAMDVLRPEMQQLCVSTTAVRCVWVDQRQSWEGHYDKFTSDGIHPTEAGAAASADQIWKAMQDSCIAQ